MSVLYVITAYASAGVTYYSMPDMTNLRLEDRKLDMSGCLCPNLSPP